MAIVFYEVRLVGYALSEIRLQVWVSSCFLESEMMASRWEVGIVDIAWYWHWKRGCNAGRELKEKHAYEHGQ
jgi:hypothetical protein